MSFKIYTKTGDQGETGLFGGKRLPKDHIRIESYGSVDELNSFIGFLNDQISILEIKQILVNIQNKLFVLGSMLATEPGKNLSIPIIQSDDIKDLEDAIDKMDAELPPLKNFILPGGHPIVSSAHICRTVCRRAERHCVALDHSDPINPLIIQYLNRLSDYFFILARYLGKELGASELEWHSK